jgi:hypothetical protein
MEDVPASDTATTRPACWCPTTSRPSPSDPWAMAEPTADRPIVASPRGCGTSAWARDSCSSSMSPPPAEPRPRAVSLAPCKGQGGSCASGQSPGRWLFITRFWTHEGYDLKPGRWDLHSSQAWGALIFGILLSFSPCGSSLPRSGFVRRSPWSWCGSTAAWACTSGSVSARGIRAPLPCSSAPPCSCRCWPSSASSREGAKWHGSRPSRDGSQRRCARTARRGRRNGALARSGHP